MNDGDIVFVDSNVLLYYVDPADQRKRARANEWLNHLWGNGSGRISWQVLHEFYWNAVKKMRLDPADARQIVETLWYWRPLDTSLGLVKEAWEWVDVAKLSYWDALIVAAAERSNASFLLSEDLQAGRIFRNVQVLNPFEISPFKPSA
jgi:predicted nucleic acid-binding protein